MNHRGEWVLSKQELYFDLRIFSFVNHRVELVLWKREHVACEGLFYKRAF